MMYRALLDNLQGKTPDAMAPFLWLHWEDDACIVTEIEKIYDSGIRAVCIESRTHEDFCGDGWWEDVALILQECQKRDMKLWILDDKHFPSGYANGAFEEKYQHLRRWEIVERHVDVAGPVADGSLMSEGWRWVPEEDEILGIYAVRLVPESHDLTGEAIDLTANQHDGMVYFDLPEGAWRVFFLVKTRFYMRPSGKNYGDPFDASATDVFLNEVYQKHYDHFAPYFGNTLEGFFSDEPSFGNNSARGFTTPMGQHTATYPWTDALRSGDLDKLLGLWYEWDDKSSQIRIDYMNRITQLYSLNFNKPIADWCHDHGVKYIGHVIEDNNAHTMTGAGTGHYFRSLRWQDMSGIDVVLHQLRPGLTEYPTAGLVTYRHMNNKFFHYILAKLGSSAAHLESNKNGMAMCEIFGAYGWAEDTKMMKWLADHMMVRGINYFVPHAFSPKDNDRDCPPNFYARGKNPQYPYFRELIGYMDRVLHMLRGGTHQASCLVLYDAEAAWTGKEYCDDEDVAKVLYDNQIDYDLIPADYLEQVEGNSGMACINGESYGAVIVPYASYLSEETVKRINRLMDQGIWVVFADGISEQVQQHLEHIPAVVSVADLADHLWKSGCCDVVPDREDAYLRFTHRKIAEQDVYFFVNEATDHVIDMEVSLKAFDGGEYCTYDALKNTAVRRNGSSGKVHLHLPPYQSVFVLTGPVPEDILPKQELALGSIQKLEPIFTISLRRAGEDAFVPCKQTSQLENITGRNGMPDFSGDIRYEFMLNTEKADRCILSLGQVGGTVRLEVNGKTAGTGIVPPFEFDITDHMQEGENKLAVTVSNHLGYQERDPFSRYMMFEPSGLLGPVELKTAQ